MMVVVGSVWCDIPYGHSRGTNCFSQHSHGQRQEAKSGCGGVGVC